MSQAFELATGDYLFEPHSGEDYTRDEGTECSQNFSSGLAATEPHCVSLLRSHRSHCGAARPDSSALRSVWQVLQRVLQQERWVSLPLCDWPLAPPNAFASSFPQASCGTSPTWSRGVCSRSSWRSTSGRWSRRLSSVTFCWPCWSWSLSGERRQLSVCSTPGCTREPTCEPAEHSKMQSANKWAPPSPPLTLSNLPQTLPS